ncbi:MAG: hypothetical protein ACOC9J_04850 [Persicimonas sp.]
MSEEPAANPYATPSAILEDEEPEEEAVSGPKLASRWSRLAATVIDYVVVGPVVHGGFSRFFTFDSA